MARVFTFADAQANFDAETPEDYEHDDEAEQDEDDREPDDEIDGDECDRDADRYFGDY